MKKFIFLICVSLFLSINTSAYEIPIDITVNGKYIKSDVNPYIKNSRTYVPIRFISEAIGCMVYWENGTAIIEGDKTIMLYPDKDYAYVDGELTAVDAPAELVSNRTFVPLRFVAETFGCDVEWDEKYYCVIIENENININDEYTTTPKYDKDSIFWLARIIESESGGESMDGKTAVGNVVLNRVASSEFPNTIYGVIFDNKHGIQFQPVMNGTIYNEPSLDSYIAAKLALSGHNTAGDSLYFLNPTTASNLWIVYNRTYLCSIGNHDFYL